MSLHALIHSIALPQTANGRSKASIRADLAHLSRLAPHAGNRAAQEHGRTSWLAELTGSLYHGTFGPTSDIDVIFKGTPPVTRKERMRVMERVRQIVQERLPHATVEVSGRGKSVKLHIHPGAAGGPKGSVDYVWEHSTFTPAVSTGQDRPALLAQPRVYDAVRMFKDWLHDTPAMPKVEGIHVEALAMAVAERLPSLKTQQGIFWAMLMLLEQAALAMQQRQDPSLMQAVVAAARPYLPPPAFISNGNMMAIGQNARGALNRARQGGSMPGVAQVANSLSRTPLISSAAPSRTLMIGASSTATPGGLACPLCERTKYQSQEALAAHMAMAHSDVASRKRILPGGRLVCPCCPRQYDSEAARAQHRRDAGH